MRFSTAVLTAAAGERDINPQRLLRHDLPIAKVRNELPRLGDVHDARPPVLAVIGDSHADALIERLTGTTQR